MECPDIASSNAMSVFRSSHPLLAAALTLTLITSVFASLLVSLEISHLVKFAVILQSHSDTYSNCVDPLTLSTSGLFRI